MKKIVQVRYVILFVFMGLFLNACSDSDSEYRVAYYSYLLQKNEGNTKMFSPYIWVAGPTESISSVTVVGNGAPLSGNIISANTYETSLQYRPLGEACGTYTVTAESQMGSSKTFDVYLNVNEAHVLGDIDLKTFRYVGQFDSISGVYKRGTVEAEFQPVTNANIYGLVFRYVYKATGNYRAYSEFYLTSAEELNNYYKVVYDFDVPQNGELEEMKVAFFAGYRDEYGKLYLESDYKTISPTNGSFLEGNLEAE